MRDATTEERKEGEGETGVGKERRRKRRDTGDRENGKSGQKDEIVRGRERRAGYFRCEFCVFRESGAVMLSAFIAAIQRV